jgi:hypothetical protein
VSTGDDEFLSRFKSELAKFVPGDPTDPKTTLAPPELIGEAPGSIRCDLIFAYLHANPFGTSR